MSTTGRQIVWSIGLTFLTSIMIGAALLFVFPLKSWSELWTRQLMDIPVIVFIPAFSIVFGTVIGAVFGLYWRNQLRIIDQSLRQLEQGKQLELSGGAAAVTEIQAISHRLEKIGKQLTEQTMASQRLATEKAVDVEARIQQMIEQERTRLARELHDSVSQQLFAASMMMSAINETRRLAENDWETKQLLRVEEMIHQSQLEMRALLLHLRPIALKNKSLQAGIEELLIELSQKVTMDIKWKVEPFPVDKGVEDHLFRILQESVSNTLRHANASSLEVLLIKREDFIIMRVVDDGVGFEVNEAKAGSYGMQNMHERAVEIGGTLKVISVRNKGTRLEVKVPVIKRGEGDDD